VALEVIPFNAAEERRVIGRIKTAIPIYWNVLAKLYSASFYSASSLLFLL